MRSSCCGEDDRDTNHETSRENRSEGLHFRLGQKQPLGYNMENLSFERTNNDFTTARTLQGEPKAVKRGSSQRSNLNKVGCGVTTSREQGNRRAYQSRPVDPIPLNSASQQRNVTTGAPILGYEADLDKRFGHGHLLCITKIRPEVDLQIREAFGFLENQKTGTEGERPSGSQKA
uniref:Uncharacterized protein n=1 Tax=Steinernema glaseri TaxID=37863 RepID=A0A1I7Y6S0_9BILA